MSRKRQPRPHPRDSDGLLVRTWATTHSPGASIPPHSHDWNQLVYASEGVMSVHTAHGTWVVPPDRAVWVPAGVEHWEDMSGRVTVRSLYFAAKLSHALPSECRAVNVPPLLRELILHTIRLGLLHQDVPREARLAGILLDQLEALPAVPLQLPMPRDPRARIFAGLLERHPGAVRKLTAFAREVGASRRTLERLFRAETHLTLGRWRQRLRLIHALRHLATGRSVTRVALDLGYDSPSAFVAMFKRELGTTPGRYFRG
ncbi:MAG TPA: helix-turn-helix transcriptional regulator [Thermoanaerobaculia bacterium]|nr:helix-turn-helix transcriptional regulator [Thermoanaerobaculia bacterium]